MSADLVVTLHGRVLARASFSQPLVRIGRSPDNDVFIDNLAFSRYHATIQRIRAGLHVLTDTGTQNGTFVNGKRITTWNLGDGDRISIGKFVLTFRCKDALPSPAPLKIEGGRTVSVETRPPVEETETRCPRRARLVLLSGERHEVARDVFSLGSDPSSDLVVPGWLVPKKLALLARGTAGFTVVNLAGKGWVKKNGQLVDWHASLDEDCVLGFGRVQARFELAPSELPGRLAPCPT